MKFEELLRFIGKDGYLISLLDGDIQSVTVKTKEYDIDHDFVSSELEIIFINGLIPHRVEKGFRNTLIKE